LLCSLLRFDDNIAAFESVKHALDVKHFAPNPKSSLQKGILIIIDWFLEAISQWILILVGTKELMRLISFNEVLYCWLLVCFQEIVKVLHVFGGGLIYIDAVDHLLAWLIIGRLDIDQEFVKCENFISELSHLAWVYIRLNLGEVQFVLLEDHCWRQRWQVLQSISRIRARSCKSLELSTLDKEIVLGALSQESLEQW